MILNLLSLRLNYYQHIADNANRILKCATTAAPLKYLNNFWRSLEMPLINCKVELKLKWTKYCVLSVAGNESGINNIDNANDIVFTVKDTKLYVPVVTLSARDNQKLSKLLREGLTKSENKNTANEFRYFLESKFVRFNRLFVLVYSNHGNNAKHY